VSAFRAGGEAAFEMDCGHALRPADTACGHSYTYRSIMGSGTIRELTALEEKRTALNAIMVHMTGREWKLPETLRGVGAVALGYPAREASQPAARKQNYIVRI